METCVYPGDIIKSLIFWTYSTFLRLSNCFQRCPPSKRNFIIVAACFVYLFFVVSQVGHSSPHQGRRIDKHDFKRSRGLYILGLDDAPSETADDLPTGADADQLPSAVPTRSNVVYITLKSKRLKPAIIRGTVRPKLRRKTRRIKPNNDAFTRNKGSTLERDGWRQRRTDGNISWKEIRNVRDTNHDVNLQTEHHVNSIRIYSEKAPPWFSKEDIGAMRSLADGKVSRIDEVSLKGSVPFLLFETATLNPPDNRNDVNDQNVCRGLCGVIKRPVDTSEVFAFHLDRVLGLNRSMPAVSRKFSYLQDGQPCPVVLWDDSLVSRGDAGDAADRSIVRLTWGEYQRSLKQRCWFKNVTPKPDAGCFPIHHYEWSKLALFDFLLQIYHRLDRSCCGFRPRVEDVCVEMDHHAQCGDKDSVSLANIIHRGRDPRHLVFTDNKGFFDRDEDNLDFKLLEGIKEFPEQAVGVLRSQRLRERLLQSLFLDQVYWESQGGRPGIEKLIDVIQRRAIVLLTYANAHGVKVVPMNV